jgi:hypothetical protein
MRKFFVEGFDAETISFRPLLIIAELAIGLCYALATILGVMGAQRYAAPDIPIPDNIISGIFIGTAIWASLAGLSIRKTERIGYPSIKSRIPFAWILISFITCTAIPVLYVYQQIGELITIRWIQFIKTCLFAALSFGLGGVIIGLTAILLYSFFWRFLASLKWGKILTCAIAFLLGLSVGWAAYGWMVFSSQALFSLNLRL